jgi:hypothetical protein
VKTKISNILLASGLYLVLHIATVGVPVNDHYCGNLHVDTAIGLPGDDPCGEMPVDGSCCDDKTVIYSVSDSFTKSTFSLQLTFVPLLDWSDRPIDEFLSQDNSYKIRGHILPPLIEHRLYVRVQSFLL